MTDKKRLNKFAAWREARDLIWAHRGQMAIGFGLMLVNRLTGMVLPASSKFLIDDVVGAGKTDLLMPLAGAVAAATTGAPTVPLPAGLHRRGLRHARRHGRLRGDDTL